MPLTVEAGSDDFTVMDISGHSSTRMLARYTHPTEARKREAWSRSAWAQTGHNGSGRDDGESELVDETSANKKAGGPHGARTHDLRVANAALSQLS